MGYKFASINPAIEKLLEAEYFLASSVGSNGRKFQYEINAFLSAARNVTFVLQACLSDVPEFRSWYADCQDRMKSDQAMKCFTELRNISLKKGPIAIVGGSTINGLYSYRFVSSQIDLPLDMMNRDVRIVCAEHLFKLAQLLKSCCEAFPFHCCPNRAFSEAGMSALGYSILDAEVAAGYPPGWTDVIDIPLEVKLSYLRKEIEEIDTCSVERISNGMIACDQGPVDFSIFLGDRFLDYLVDSINASSCLGPRVNFISAIARAISDVDRSADDGGGNGSS